MPKNGIHHRKSPQQTNRACPDLGLWLLEALAMPFVSGLTSAANGDGAAGLQSFLHVPLVAMILVGILRWCSPAP